MPQQPIISVRGLGKRYRLGETLQHDMLRDHLSGLVRRVLRRDPASDAGPREEEFWALKDVSFDVEEGEVLGIIGRNGAGKSTLLKVLSRISEPTTGEIRTRGRVASLLEVGTGFHPELTGRENVFLNGAILGMRQAEIKAKFDEIVAFSGVERFLDTPVKRYSSGMYVRLAFAVAAHLEPEILIVDEVLAVGDAAFQKKCLGKMKDVAGHGRTVLFVSHNMAMISGLCPNSLLLADGRLTERGPSGTVIISYLAAMAGPQSHANRGVVGDDVCRLLSAETLSSKGAPVREIDIDQALTVSMTYSVLRSSEHVRFVPNFHFHTAGGTCAFVANAPAIQPGPPGTYIAKCLIPGHFLNEGPYWITVVVTSYCNDSYTVHFTERNLLPVNVRDAKVPTERNYGYVEAIPGVVRPQFAWEVQRVE